MLQTNCLVHFKSINVPFHYLNQYSCFALQQDKCAMKRNPGLLPSNNNHHPPTLSTSLFYKNCSDLYQEPKNISIILTPIQLRNCPFPYQLVHLSPVFTQVRLESTWRELGLISLFQDQLTIARPLLGPGTKSQSRSNKSKYLNH